MAGCRRNRALWIWLLAVTINQVAWARPPAKTEAALAEFQQAVYEFACHLALQEGGDARADLREAWRRLSKLRNLACPAALRRDLTRLQNTAPNSASAPKLLDQIEAQLKELPGGINPQPALERLQRARAALTEKNGTAFRPLSLEIQDALVGEAVGAPVIEFVAALRDVEQILGSRPSAAKMAEALARLRKLPNAERARLRAYREGLQVASDLLASAIDLYTERYDRDAAEQLTRLFRPLRLSAVARGSDTAAARLRQVEQRVRQAQLKIERGYDNWYQNERAQGLRELSDLQDELLRLLDSSEQLSADQVLRSAADATRRDPRE